MVFLQPKNEQHHQIMLKGLCPRCGAELNLGGFCITCQNTYIIQLVTTGWCHLTEEYTPDAFCVHHESYPEALYA